jgi:hypothetical protein
VSGLVAAGGRIVYLGVDDQGGLQLIGLDPATGKVVWHRPSTAATHISGVSQQVVVNGDTVFNVEAGGTAASKVAYPAQATSAFEVVAVDGRTGTDSWHHPFDDLTTPLDKCGDGLCVGTDAPAGHFHITRLDFKTGDVLSEGSEAFEPIVAEDGELAISAARDSSDVVLTSGFGKTVVWKHQRSELFGSVDVTPDGGWSGLHIGGTWIVWLGSEQTLGATSGITDDGRMLWTRAETSPCFILTGDPLVAPVLCGHVDPGARNLTVGTIEGIDPTTGATQWSFDAGDLDLLHIEAAMVRFDATRFAFHRSTGDVELDLASGPTATAPPSKAGWCLTIGASASVEGRPSIVAASWAPCTLGVGPDQAPPTSVPAFAGPTVNGFGAWIEDSEVRAAKVS